MRFIRFNDLEYLPASHEDHHNPSVFKKVLAKRDDLPAGKIQMINWGKLLKGRAFAAHFHESMTEVFVIVSGEAKITINTEQAHLGQGDMVIIPEGATHIMEASGDGDCHYLAIGITREARGEIV